MTKPSIFARFWKGVNTSTAGTRYERLMSYIGKIGGDVNAYAVCTAMLGDNTFKSMNDDDFMKEVEVMLRKLGISGAGAVPNSLLSMQDLEPREKFQKDEKPDEDSEGYQGQPRDSRKNMGLWVCWLDSKGNEQTREFLYQADAEAYARLITAMDFGYTDISIQKAVETDKAISNYTVRSSNQEYGRFDMIEDARAMIDYLRMQGVYAVLVEENVVKGPVETTGKQLDRAAEKAKNAETISEKKSVAENIKAIQMKRQRATIAERTRDMTGKSFKEEWSNNKKSL